MTQFWHTILGYIINICYTTLQKCRRFSVIIWLLYTSHCLVLHGTLTGMLLEHPARQRTLEQVLGTNNCIGRLMRSVVETSLSMHSCGSTSNDADLSVLECWISVYWAALR